MAQASTSRKRTRQKKGNPEDRRGALPDRRPLAGIRIADFTWFWAGPYATMLLAMLGAEVIKIETIHRLDPMRLDQQRRSAFTGRDPATIPLQEVEKSVLWHDINLSKMSVRLNLRYPEAQEVARRLVTVSDVVVENFSPGVMRKLGLGYESLRKLRPDVVMMSSSACGQTGPESHYVGYATIFNAISGMGHLTGYPDLPPADIRDGSDLRVATTSAFALLAALRHQRLTGEGQYIDLSAKEVLTTLIGDAIIDYQMTGRVRVRAGNQDDILAPHNCYPARGRDRWISIAVANDEEWRGLCRAMGRPDLMDDARFNDAYRRWQNQKGLDELIAQWTAEYDAIELMHLLQKHGVAAAPSMNGKDIFNDLHLKEWGAFAEVEHPIMGRRAVVGVPWRFSESSVKVERAPLMGEHGEHVFGDVLGMSAGDIERLVEQGVIA
ncbi:MAG: CoA transferase [Chloroflexi bacterium]|nr:CoA transferase [Chloroflexota bacterium]